MYSLRRFTGHGSNHATQLVKNQMRFATVSRENVRNIAVIAHVDHGKTTIVDSMLRQSGTVAEAKGRVMDSKDQEKERGITILAKNTAIVLEGGAGGDPNSKRINIVDTPGHLDFGGEVERALQMVEGFILLVDAKEGVRPGTRYVLRKALNLGLRPIVCLNKIDKEDTNISKSVSAVQDLFLETITDEEQLDHLFFMYGSGRSGYMNLEPVKEGTLKPLFDQIFEKVPAPKCDDADPLQFLVAQVNEDSETKQKVLIGRIFKGSVKVDDVVTVALQDKRVNGMVKQIKLFVGVHQEKVSEAKFGDVCALYIQEPVAEKIPLVIGATVCSQGNVNVYPYKKPDEPTYTLRLKKTDSPWKGKETGDNFSLLPFIQTRLEKEALVNTALCLEGLGTPQITMMGRGPLHLSVIIEDMRREGFEFDILAPTVITRTVNGEIHEPYERVNLEYKESMGAEVVGLLASKMAEVQNIIQLSGGRNQIECVMPVRLMASLPGQFHTLTGGDGVLNHSFDGYAPRCALESERDTGALISVDNGKVEEYSLTGHQGQGRFFVLPGDEVYYGQIVGENTKTKLQNLGINVCKKNEQQGGMRANATDKATKRVANYKADRYNFEQSIAWITDDEVVTVTPKSIRMRKPGFNGKTSMRSMK